MSATTQKHLKKVLKEVFGNIPVVEAKENLRLQPLPCDMDGADPLSPNNCLLVHTARRMYGARAAVFWKTTAYIDFIDEDGIRRVHRYLNPAKTIAQIADFDRGKPFAEGRGLILIRPPRSCSRKARGKAGQKYYRSNKGIKQQKINSLRQRMGAIERRLERAEEQKERAVNVAAPPAKIKEIGARIKEEQHKLAATRAALIKAKAEPVRNLAARSYIFDLTTRNGAAGNYTFVPQ